MELKFKANGAALRIIKKNDLNLVRLLNTGLCSKARKGLLASVASRTGLIPLRRPPKLHLRNHTPRDFDSSYRNPEVVSIFPRSVT